MNLRRAFAAILWIPAIAAAQPVMTSPSLTLPDFRKPAPPTKRQRGEVCNDCGRVRSVREVAVERRAPVPPTFQGASRGVVDYNLVGAVVYLPLSSSSSDRPMVGGVGTPEMRERFGGSTYAVTVELDDGRTRVLERADGSRYQVGDRVRLIGASELELVAE